MERHIQQLLVQWLIIQGVGWVVEAEGENGGIRRLGGKGAKNLIINPYILNNTPFVSFF